MFKNGKKKIGLIALLSCVLTATVAFAAYTGYNYIRGTVNVVGNPFEMLYADKNGTIIDCQDGTGQIPADGHATINGVDATDDDVDMGIVSNLTVQEPDDGGQTLRDLRVKLYEKDDEIKYTFKIKNAGGATAYLSNIEIEAFNMPYTGDEERIAGPDGIGALKYTVDVGGVVATSLDGELGTVNEVPAVSVAAGASVDVTVTVTATDSSLFAAYDSDEDEFGAVITLGQVHITWSAVPNAND